MTHLSSYVTYGDPLRVCRLMIYGLKQLPRAWFDKSILLFPGMALSGVFLITLSLSSTHYG